MKTLKILFYGFMLVSIASCATARSGFDYKGHAKTSKKYAKAAEKRTHRTGGNLTLFDCSK